MAFIQSDNVVQTFPSDRTNEAFCDAILPGGAKSRFLDLQAHITDRFTNGVAETAIVVHEHIFCVSFPGKGFPDLLLRPALVRVSRDVKMKNFPTLMMITKKTYKILNPIVGTVKKSMAAMLYLANIRNRTRKH